MKRLGTLALAVILITGCNAMKPKIEETELLSKEIEKRIYTQAWPTEASEITDPVPTQAATTIPQPAEPVFLSHLFQSGLSTPMSTDHFYSTSIQPASGGPEVSANGAEPASIAP